MPMCRKPFHPHETASFGQDAGGCDGICADGAGETVSPHPLLEQSYGESLTEAADLRNAVARLEALVALLQRQLRNANLQSYITGKLGSAFAQQEALLSKPFFAPACRRAKLRMSRDIDLVRNSTLFDAEWYGAMYVNAVEKVSDTASYFVAKGAYQLHNPGPGFNSLDYHIAHPDVTAAGIPAFLHYLRNGNAERRAISSVGTPLHRPSLKAYSERIFS